VTPLDLDQDGELAPPRERWFGWIGLMVIGLTAFALPVWALLTTVFIQLDPELSGFDRDDELLGEFGPSRTEIWLAGGARAALWLGVAAPLVAMLLFCGALVWYLGERRGRAKRVELDALVAADAVLDDVENWSPKGSADSS